MWLRDSLPYDMEGVRVLTYGYDTSLVGSQTFQSIDDIAISFNKGIRRIRSHINVSGLCGFFLFFLSIAKLISTGQRRTTASHLHIPQPWRCYPEKGTAAFTCL